MLIWLTRHAIALDRADPDCPLDPDRPLTKSGARRMRQAARGLVRLGVDPEAILSSPYRRALETAEILADAFGLTSTAVLNTRTLEPDGVPDEFLAELAELGLARVLCTGHSPQLDRTLGRMLGFDENGTGPITHMKKGSTACVDIEIAGEAAGKLVWLLPPRVLRRLGAKG